MTSTYVALSRLATRPKSFSGGVSPLTTFDTQPRAFHHPKALWGAGFAPTCDIPAIFGRRLTVRPTPLSYILTLQGMCANLATPRTLHDGGI